MKKNYLQHLSFWKSDFRLSANFNILVLIFILLLSGREVTGQTTVFTDNFNRDPLGTIGGTPEMTWTTVTTSQGYTKTEGTSPNFRLAIYNGATSTAAATSTGRTYLYGSLNTFWSPFNPNLSSNKDDIVWTFNIRTGRTTGDNGFNASANYFGYAVVLCATGSDFLAANGYAVTLRKGTLYNAVRLERFSGGLTNNSNLTTLIGPSTDLLSSGTNHYFSVKVVYTALTNTWKMYARIDGSSPLDPESGTLTQVGTEVVDNTYTGSAMTHCGFFVNHQSTSWNSGNNKGNFDNFKVVVDNRTFIPISNQFDWNTGSNWTQGFTPASNYDVELPYTAIVRNTSAASCKNLIINSFSDTQSTQFIKQAAFTVSDKIRLKVKFTNANVWRFVGFPFPISAIYKADGLTPAILNTDYHMARYNIDKRANGQSGWEEFSTLPTVAGEGYIIASAADLVFETAQNPATDAFAASNDRALTYNTGTGSANHSGWNFVVSPVLANATTMLNTGEFRYSYNGTTYNVDDETDGTLIEYPFRAVFIKTGAARNMTVVASNPFLSPRRKIDTTPDRIHLKLIAGSNEYTTKIRINDLATEGYDSQYDAEQMFPFSSTVPQIYSVSGNTKLAINSVPQNSVVHIALRLSESGIYKLKWEKQAVSTMLLYDSEEGRYVNTDNDKEYEFYASQSGNIANRFKIYTGSDATTRLNNLPASKDIRLHVNGLNIEIEGMYNKCFVTVFDMMGRKILESSVNASTNSIRLPRSGMYILKISTPQVNAEFKVNAY